MTSSSNLTTLLRRWNDHEDLRRSGAPVGALAASRAELERTRADVRGTGQHRAAFTPSVVRSR